jgi:putative FmdB family regulatory protein
MPIYEYYCDECVSQMEFLQDIDDSPFTQCPKCKSDKFRKLVSVASFKLTGTGWYETDFKNSKKSDSKSTTSSSVKK